MKIRITGFAMATADVRTLGDLREFVRWLDKHGVSDHREVEAGEVMYVSLQDTTDGDTAKFIECGDHIPPNKAFDVVMNTHKHVNDYPANYEEALEDALPVDVPQFDWVTRDRYNDPGRPE